MPIFQGGWFNLELDRVTLYPLIELSSWFASTPLPRANEKDNNNTTHYPKPYLCICWYGLIWTMGSWWSSSNLFTTCNIVVFFLCIDSSNILHIWRPTTVLVVITCAMLTFSCSSQLANTASLRAFAPLSPIFPLCWNYK